jgi:excisionase family DNA binding protein
LSVVPPRVTVAAMSDDSLLDPDQLAAYLKIPKRSIYGWRVKGIGPPAIKVGKYLRWQRADVDEWLRQQREEG